MRDTLKKAISDYTFACMNTDWLSRESYKFAFANYIHKKVQWTTQSDSQVLEILSKSQEFRYPHTSGKGIQFLQKSGREKLSRFIIEKDIALFRKLAQGDRIMDIDWSERTMSYTGLSVWLSSLFPNSLYPIPFTGYVQTLPFLFELQEKLPKKGLSYIMACQAYMRQTHHILKQHLHPFLFLENWNALFTSDQAFDISDKTKLSSVDWNWIVQDFHLFVHRKILNLYKPNALKRLTTPLEENDLIAKEGAATLSTHLKHERNTALIQKIKSKAFKDNPYLNCEVCGFSFVLTYGELGQGFIEAHHLIPIGNRARRITKKNDIALVCSNCHRMLHRNFSDTPLTLTQLKEIMSKNKV